MKRLELELANERVKNRRLCAKIEELRRINRQIEARHKREMIDLLNLAKHQKTSLIEQKQIDLSDEDEPSHTHRRSAFDSLDKSFDEMMAILIEMRMQNYAVDDDMDLNQAKE